MSATKRIFFLALVSLLSFVAQIPCNEKETSKKEIVRGKIAAKVDQYLSRAMPFGFSGALLVARSDQIILNKGYGMAIREKSIPNTSETVFCTGSITKQFTAAAIMKLEMQEKLNTDDPISRYIDSVPKDKAGITLHHLLTHTAGVINSTGLDYEIVSRDEIVKRILSAPLLFPLGKKMQYSNAGYSLLAAIVEEVSGKPYERFLNEQLFKPAGMSSTGYRMPNWKERVVAHWYNGETDNGTPLEKSYPYWNLLGNGGILSTTADMYRWHLALLGEKVLSNKAKKKLFTPFLNDYAYGWDVLKTRRGVLIQHDGGSTLGNSAEISRYIDAGVVTILFCNQSYGGDPLFEAVRDKIETLVFEGKVMMPPDVVIKDSLNLSKYEGTYKLSSGEELIVSSKDYRLVLVGKGKEAFILLFSGDLGSQKLSSDLNDRTAIILEKSAKHDYRPLYEAFEKQIPLERIESMELEMWQARKQHFGSFKGFEVLATVSDLTEGATTFVRLDFERGFTFLQYLWKGNSLGGIRPLQALPENVYLPQSETDFVAYNLRSSTTMRLRFSLEEKGLVTGLIFHGKSGDITAGKVK